MYVPAAFAESDREPIEALIRDHPLGTLVTLGRDGLTANHIPFELYADLGPHGTLRAHVARNNEVWQDVRSDIEALVVFQGPTAYISPNWYPTKQATHRVVPTYNYAVVHAYGPLIVHDDARWLRAQLGRLTKLMEASQPEAWTMGQAPQDFLGEMIASVVGIEIPLTRLVGKWKVSQNRAAIDREGAVSGLRATGTPAAAAMADLIVDTAARTGARG